MKKRIIAGISVLMLLAGSLFAFRYLYNAYIIYQYNEKDYLKDASPLMVCNWIQPYVAHYNMGNIHYQNEKYEDAIKEYEEALLSNPGKGKECSIRINLALAMIKNLGEDYDSEENRKASIETLKEARNVLLEDGCATEHGDGHSETAEKLKKEIEDMIEELEEEEPSEPEDDNQSKETPDEKKEDDSYEQDIKEKLQQQQEEAYKEREEAMESYKEYDYEFNFDADGRVW